MYIANFNEQPGYDLIMTARFVVLSQPSNTLVTVMKCTTCLKSCLSTLVPLLSSIPSRPCIVLPLVIVKVAVAVALEVFASPTLIKMVILIW